ncbi:MAG: glycoside hydrolase family 5 protein [Chloroflexi bacterium]|nr:glycoside hydrolase family 5 protein [Chloroflexota bacterium]
MKSYMLLPAAVLLLSACNLTPTAQVTAPATVPATPAATPATTLTSTPETMDAFERNTRLSRGVNLGNALEAPNEGDWGVTLQESDFQLIKDAGFTAVRIPVRWSAHAAETAPYTIDPAFFTRVDWVIEQALSRGLAAVVNVHHYEEFFQAPEQHTARFIALWQQIASHYKDYPDDLFFEPMNEPHDISASTWNDTLATTISAIRATNPRRYLIVGPVDWNSHRRLNDLQLPADDHNLIVTFHYYLPFEFTHQGAEWASGSEKWLGTTWEGTSSQRDNLDFDLDVAARWGQDNHRPIFLGEFGAYSKADMTSRARWTAYVARQAEARGMSWAYWEFRSGFGVYDGQSQRWNEQLLKALVPSHAAPTTTPQP